MSNRGTGEEVRTFERATAKQPATPKPPPAEMAIPGKVMRAANAEDFPIALARGGKTLATGRGVVVTVGEVATSELTAPAVVNELVFTPDGMSLVACDAITLWDAASGAVSKSYKLPAVADGDGSLRTGVAISPAGTHAVQQFVDGTAANGVLRVTDLATGKSGEDIKLSVGGSQSFAFSPDGKRMAWASFTDGVVVWDVPQSKQIASFGKGEGRPQFFGNSLRFSDDGERLAVTLANDAIEVRDLTWAKLVHTLGGHETERTNRVAVGVVVGAGNRMTLTDMAFATDGKAIAASFGNATVRQYDLTSGKGVARRPATRPG